MIGQITAFLFLTVLIFVPLAACQAIATWSMRTPRSGYLILAAFALYILARNLP